LPASSIKSRQLKESIKDRWLDIEEVRLVGDLRIMHSKVDELYHVVNNLRRRHNDGAVQKYADGPVLTEDINRVDEIYMWFIKLKEAAESARR
jgi:hypothetical protein